MRVPFLVCAACLAFAFCTKPVSAELTPDQEATAERIIRDFSAPEFGVRQQAVQDLIDMGPDVLPLVRKTLAETTDAEVKLRCNMVIKGFAPKPPPKPAPLRVEEKVLIDLGPMAYGRAEWGWERSRDGSGRIFRYEVDGKVHVGHNLWESPGYDSVDMMLMSESGSGSAFWAMRDGKRFMVMNGVEQPAWDRCGMPRLSVDGTRTLYSGVRGKQSFAVLDGKESAAYDSVEATVGFSADGRHAAWVAARDGKSFVVIDGHEGPAHDHVCRLNEPTGPRARYVRTHVRRYFAADAGRVRLVEYDLPAAGGDAKAALAEREVRVVAEGVGDLSKVSHWASNDGKHIICRTPPDATIWYDGKKLGTWDGLDNLNFGPDGEHFAFVARRGEKRVVVWDGKEGGEYDSVYALWLPVPGHCSYAAARDGKRFCVFDGKEDVPGYQSIISRAISDDGRHWAYSAVEGRETVVVRDGRVVARHEGVRTMAFDPTGERLAYIAVSKKLQFIVCEGKRGAGYEIVTQGPCFSKDGRHLWYSVMQFGGHFVVIDEIAGPAHDGGTEMLERFDDKDVCRFVFVDKQDVEHLVEAAWPKGVDWTNDLQPLEP